MQEHIRREYLHSGKRYVEVKARFSTAGEIRPLSILYNNREWPIEHIYMIKQKASQRAGACGICYDCRIGSRRYQLYLEETRWFLEL